MSETWDLPDGNGSITQISSKELHLLYPGLEAIYATVSSDILTNAQEALPRDVHVMTPAILLCDADTYTRVTGFDPAINHIAFNVYNGTIYAVDEYIRETLSVDRPDVARNLIPPIIECAMRRIVNNTIQMGFRSFPRHPEISEEFITPGIYHLTSDTRDSHVASIQIDDDLTDNLVLAITPLIYVNAMLYSAGVILPMHRTMVINREGQADIKVDREGIDIKALLSILYYGSIEGAIRRAKTVDIRNALLVWKKLWPDVLTGKIITDIE